jgi:hypothetical protein
MEDTDEGAEAILQPTFSREVYGRAAKAVTADTQESPRSSARKRARLRYSNELGDKTVTENEDFSMISMESLRTAKDSSFMSQIRPTGLATILEAPGPPNASTLDVSYLPSSPPKEQANEHSLYPDLENEAREAVRAPNRQHETEPDPMSWRPMSKALHSFRDSANRHSEMTTNGDSLSADAGWRPRDADQHREPQMRRDSGRQSTELRREAAAELSSGESEDDDDDVQDEEEVNMEGNEELDLWQEEASRSADVSLGTAAPRIEAIEVEPEPIEPERARSHDNIDELFSDQINKPRRSKIPRTWRRSSGISLSYADSPAHGLMQLTADDEAQEDEDEDAERKGSADGSRILTPPSTDDEQMHAPDVEADPSSEISQPDAEATRFQSDVVIAEETDTELEESAEEEDESMSEEVAEPRDEDDDTGLFFHDAVPRASTYMPNPLFNEPPRRRPRPARRDTVDLTGILNVRSSPRKPEATPKRDHPVAVTTAQNSVVKKLAQRKRFGRPVEVQQVEGQTSLETSDYNVAAAGVKRFGRKTRPPGNNHQAVVASNSHPSSAWNTRTEDSAERTDLLERARVICETNRAESDKAVDLARQPGAVHSAAIGDSEFVSASNMTAITTSFRSYEERLNLDSPGKTKVNFNDSSSAIRLPSPSKHTLPPLFRAPAGESDQSSSAIEHADPSSSKAGKPGILARLTNKLWSGGDKVTNTPEEPSLLNNGPPTQVSSISAASTSLLDETSLLEGSFPPDLRTALRTRYGVLSSSFPWRLYHMRTLHRLHNSLFSGRKDTLVPSSGALPRSLAHLVGSKQLSITEVEFTFTKQHAYIVQAFLSLFVPAHVVEGMLSGEVEALGDRLTGELRGVAARGDEFLRRSGMHDSVWTASDTATWVDSLKGEIGVQFVVRALGDVAAEEQRVRKRKRI